MELRSTTANDLQTILGWVKNNQEMVMWSGPTFTWPLEYAQLERYFHNPNRTYWSAIDTESQELVGHASLLIDNDADLMRVGFIIVNPEYRGRGVGREFVDAVVCDGFQASTLPVMKLGVYAHNTAALKLYESLGFSKTGVVFQTTVDEEQWDVLDMARPAVTG
ncbi:GNAT family N-acetyltransferase [Arthrobacter sp. NPDC092385]|uniref:GNAT family N-acetyltransferase n=1 Tax=Arthrobacter sp. NPDC092385 TaxID=3363943 RepID=UPI003806BFF4